MPGRRVKEFLENNGVKFVNIYHSPHYTAQEIAAAAHIRGKELAKTVMVKIDGKMAMAVLPASHRVDLSALKKISGAQTVELAGEGEFKDLFPDCDIGAMPPFGNLYGLPVYSSEALTRDEEIAFNAGSHYHLFRMGYKDFERLVKPKVAGISGKIMTAYKSRYGRPEVERRV